MIISEAMYRFYQEKKKETFVSTNKMSSMFTKSLGFLYSHVLFSPIVTDY